MSATIRVNLTANVEQMQKQLKRQAAQLTKFRERAKGASGGMKSMSKSATGLLGAVTPLRLTLAGLTTGLVAFAKGQLSSIDRIGKLSTAFGVGVETLQKWQHAADLGGSSLEAVAKGSKKLSETIYDANSGLVTYQRAFDDLGLSWVELAAMTPEEQMNAVADALTKVDDKSKRAALASDVLGRAGVELLPTLEDLEENASTLAESAILTKEQVQAVENFNDSITILQAKIKGVFYELVEKLSPPMKSIIGFIKRNGAVAVGLLAGAVAGLAIKLGIATANMVAFNIAFLSNPIGLIIAGVVALVAAIVTAAIKFQAFRDVLAVVGRFFRDKLWPVIKETPRLFMTGFKHILDGVSWLVNGIKSGFQGAFNWVVDKAISFVQSVLGVFEKGASFFDKVFGTDIEGVVGDLKTSLEDMRDGFKLDIADIDLAEEWGLNGWLNRVEDTKIEISLAPPGGPGAWGSVSSPGVPSPVMSDAWKSANRGLYTNFGTSLWEALFDPAGNKLKDQTATTTGSVKDPRDADLKLLANRRELGGLSDADYLTELERIYATYEDKLSDKAMGVWRRIESVSTAIADEANAASLRLAESGIAEALNFEALSDLTRASEEGNATLAKNIAFEIRDKMVGAAMLINDPKERREALDEANEWLGARFQEIADNANAKRDEAIETAKRQEKVAEEQRALAAQQLAELKALTASEADDALSAALLQGKSGELYRAFLALQEGLRKYEAGELARQYEAGTLDTRIQHADGRPGFWTGTIDEAYQAAIERLNARIDKTISEYQQQLAADPDNLRPAPFWVRVKIDDQPERDVRAESGWVNSRPRGAC